MFFFFLFKATLFSNLRSTLSRDALIHGYAVQPRRNFCFATKRSDIPKGGQERFLGCVARILLTAEHAEGKRENPSLPALHNLAERFCVAR
jgi:hypothetical protein